MKSDFDGWDSARTFATEAGSLALQGLMFGFGVALGLTRRPWRSR